jgi:hypothetical protein
MSGSYAYYSFPPTPTRSSPAGIRTKRPLSPDSPTMAPSPAAGKGATPKTPTKLARRPQQAASQAGEKAKGAAEDVSSIRTPHPLYAPSGVHGA